MTQLQKRVAALLLSGATLVSGFGGVLAYDETKANTQADALKEMGLLQGSDKGYELSRAPSRMDSLVMLLRMTGLEEEARRYEGTHPFVDGPTWDFAPAYLAYAFDKGLTAGVDATHFDPNSPATAQTYVTFMLRALGYDSATAWDSWESLGKTAGLLPGGVDTKNFLRGDMVMISYAALDAKLSDGSMTLEEKLMKDQVFTSFDKARADLKAGAPVSKDSSLPLIMAHVYAGIEELQGGYLSATDITKENMKAFLGVDTLKIDEGYAVEPMLTARAHSVVLLRLTAGEDVEAAKQAIADNVNPFKWICVGVDSENVRVDNIGNLIVLIMDNNHADTLQSNFKALPMDAKGAVLLNGSVVEKQTLDTKSVENLAKKMNELQTTHMSENKVYYSIIPDKSYYARKDFDAYLNHEAMMTALRPLVSKTITEVDFSDQLSFEDYYRTDLHWRQEALDGVISRLGEAMDFTVDWKKFTPQTSDFVGSYQRLLDSLKSEPFQYMVSSDTEKTTVSLYGQEEAAPVYDTNKLNSSDPYGLFLSSLSPLTVLKNPQVTTPRRLVIFSDSFGTSFAPLLLEAYSEITLVDLRFMAPSLIPQHVDFKDAEVLFLYSGQIANNSHLLR